MKSWHTEDGSLVVDFSLPSEKEEEEDMKDKIHNHTITFKVEEEHSHNVHATLMPVVQAMKGVTAAVYSVDYNIVPKKPESKDMILKWGGRECVFIPTEPSCADTRAVYAWVSDVCKITITKYGDGEYIARLYSSAYDISDVCSYAWTTPKEAISHLWTVVNQFWTQLHNALENGK